MNSPMDTKYGLRKGLTTNRAACTINYFTAGDGHKGALLMTSQMDVVMVMAFTTSHLMCQVSLVFELEFTPFDTLL
jgi:hypothetical protein